jgi:neutral ceramidase
MDVMNLGAAQIDITPQPGVELSGFAARIQPSVGVLDPLFARALYLADGKTRVLWIQCDLVGVDRSIVLNFRRWAQAELGLTGGQVILSATHTHSGPCTIHLEEAGQYDAAYVDFLLGRLREAAQAAIARTEAVAFVSVEGYLDLASDRRKTASSHTDPRVAALGFRRTDGTFAAVVVNYPMHPVALGATNRRISADIPGQAALALTRQIPGAPIVLVTNGACANLNPPAENVSFAQIEAWGKQLADAVAPLLKQARPRYDTALRITARTLPLPMDTLDAAGIESFAARALRDEKSLLEWGDKYRRVVEHWRCSLTAEVRAGRINSHREAELFGLCIGDVVLLGANAEVFSEFTDWLRRDSGRKVYLIGYANGDLGYLPTRAAYQEGGYEVEVAHMFYGGFRPKAGSLELLASAAAELVGRLKAGARPTHD